MSSPRRDPADDGFAALSNASGDPDRASNAAQQLTPMAPLSGMVAARIEALSSESDLAIALLDPAGPTSSHRTVVLTDFSGPKGVDALLHLDEAGWESEDLGPPCVPEDDELFDASILVDFIGESRDYLRHAEAALLQLETEPTAMEPINVVFRAFHTIKGTAAFLGLEQITEIAHHAESLLQRFREGELRCTGPRADLALRSVDMLQTLVSVIEAATLLGETAPQPLGYAALLRDLENLPIEVLADPEEKPQKIRLGDILVEDGLITRERLEEVFATKGDESIGLALVRTGAVSLQDVAKALRKQQGNAAPDPSHETVKLPKKQLESLFEIVDALHAFQVSGALDAPAANSSGRSLAELVRRLHETSLSLRSVPVGEVFSKMTRVARDAARRAAKEIELVVSGEDVEVPRGIAGHLADPLVHMIRNAIDHGIEPTDVREAVAKPRTGLVCLSAERDENGVVITVADDGRGLDRDRILERGLADGLILSAEDASDADVCNLVFRPGFSTVNEVTELSGRGVGMDVVRKNIEAAGGTVEITSMVGVGTTFVIRFGFAQAD